MRIQLTDALENRWMRREHARQTFGEKHMRRLLGVRRDERRPFRQRGDLHQRALEALRIARELYPRGIREALTLARHRRLENAACHEPDITQHHDREAQRHQPARVAAVTRRDLQNHVADQPDHEQPKIHPMSCTFRRMSPFIQCPNGDMRLNVQLMGWVFGLFVIGLIGRVILEVSPRNRRNSGGLVALGFAVMVLGYIGLMAGGILQAAVARQRERLADASGVQFTRNPQGLKGALVKIAALPEGSALVAADAEQAAHMFFAEGLSRVFATHPPILERIREWIRISILASWKPRRPSRIRTRRRRKLRGTAVARQAAAGHVGSEA